MFEDWKINLYWSRCPVTIALEPQELYHLCSSWSIGQNYYFSIGQKYYYFLNGSFGEGTYEGTVWISHATDPQEEDILENYQRIIQF